MAPKPAPKTLDDVSADERGHLWQPPEKRNAVSEAARKWREENAPAAREWADWVEKNGLPISPLF